MDLVLASMIAGAKRSLRRLGGLAEWSGSVRSDRHVEVAYERREQRSDIGLRPADLGQRDQQQHPGTPPVGT